jgi:hypothetical protein
MQHALVVIFRRGAMLERRELMIGGGSLVQGAR